MTEAQFNAEHYPRLLADKANRIRSIFSKFGNTELEVFSSPPHHHRMRAEFRVWHDDDDLYYIMFEPETKEPFRVDQLPLASRAINDLMPRILTRIKPNDTLRRKLFQIDFLSSLSGEMVVSMLYHRPLDEGWVAEARKLRQALQTEDMELHVIGRARKMKYLVERDYVVERLHVNGSPIIYQQVENSFTQPNAVVAQKMLSWAVDCTRSLDGDLLELYCGNGNFSLALAQNFDRVLATEVSKSSIKSAQYNIDVNAIENVKVARLSADEVVEALDGVREFRRLRNAGVEIKDYRFSTVFVDPPRAGLSKDGCATASRFDHIVYISCNPATLESNLVELNKTHRVTRFAFFDQFPYTEHAEVGVRLDRR